MIYIAPLKVNKMWIDKHLILRPHEVVQTVRIKMLLSEWNLCQEEVILKYYGIGACRIACRSCTVPDEIRDRP